jgi:hypothetical protein
MERRSHPLAARAQSGIWESFIPDIHDGDTYKFHIESRFHGTIALDKADPFAFHAETAPHYWLEGLGPFLFVERFAMDVGSSSAQQYSGAGFDL